jgi:hypothetical protein
MFCPKCGNQVADNAAFCPKCGNQMRQGASTQAASPVLPSVQATPLQNQARPAAAGITPLYIVALVAAVATAIFMLLPWVEVSRKVVTAANSIGAFSSAFGGRSISVDDAYSIFGLPGMYNELGMSDDAAMVIALFVLPWVAVLIVLIIGFIKALTGNKGTKLLGAGFILATVYSVWVIAFFGSSNDLSTNVWPVITTVVSIVGVVVAFVNKSQKA